MMELNGVQPFGLTLKLETWSRLVVWLNSSPRYWSCFLSHSWFLVFFFCIVMAMYYWRLGCQPWAFSGWSHCPGFKWSPRNLLHRNISAWWVGGGELNSCSWGCLCQKCFLYWQWNELEDPPRHCRNCRHQGWGYCDGVWRCSQLRGSK